MQIIYWAIITFEEENVMSITNNRKPDFNNILKILKRQVPDRPTLFEFFLNDRLYKRLAADDKLNGNNEEDGYRTVLRAFYKGGYDYCTMMGAEFKFPSGSSLPNTSSLL